MQGVSIDTLVVALVPFLDDDGRDYWWSFLKVYHNAFEDTLPKILKADHWVNTTLGADVDDKSPVEQSSLGSQGRRCCL